MARGRWGPARDHTFTPRTPENAEAIAPSPGHARRRASQKDHTASDQLTFPQPSTHLLQPPPARQTADTSQSREELAKSYQLPAKAAYRSTRTVRQYTLGAKLAVNERLGGTGWDPKGVRETPRKFESGEGVYRCPFRARVAPSLSDRLSYDQHLYQPHKPSTIMTDQSQPHDTRTSTRHFALGVDVSSIQANVNVLNLNSSGKCRDTTSTFYSFV